MFEVKVQMVRIIISFQNLQRLEEKMTLMVVIQMLGHWPIGVSFCLSLPPIPCYCSYRQYAIVSLEVLGKIHLMVFLGLQSLVILLCHPLETTFSSMEVVVDSHLHSC